MSLVNIVNELVVDNVKKSSNFYKENFGFEIEFVDGDPIVWMQMKNGNVRIMLEEYSKVCEEIRGFPIKNNASNLIKFKYDNESEVKNIYEKLKKNNVLIFMEIKKTDYETIEFGAYDIDKNMIIVST